MKKLFVCILAVVVICIAYNIATRSSGPALQPGQVFGWSGDYALFTAALNGFLQPGAYALWYLGFDLDAPWQLYVAAVLSWWAWWTALRLSWSISGRILGFYDISTYYRWLYFAVPWRPLFRLWMKISGRIKQLSHGVRATACRASLLVALASPYRPGNSIPLGRPTCLTIGLHQPVGIDEDGHCVVIGNTGSGKTRFLLGWVGSLPPEASAVVVDCGGQAANSLARPLARAGRKAWVWDPRQISQFESAHWNPLDELVRTAIRKNDPAAMVDGAMAIGRVVRDQNEHQPIFDDGARQFLAAEALYAIKTAPPERRNMVYMRQLLALGRPDLVKDAKQDPFDALLDDMIAMAQVDDGCGGAINSVIARGAGVMKSGKGREGNPFRTSALIATQFLDIPEVAATMTHSDFSVEDFKTSNDILFISASVDEIRGPFSGPVRVLVALMVRAFQDIPQHRKTPCALFLDEAPSIGIPDLDVAAANYRKDDIRVVIATQDLPILRKAYPKGWKTLMGSAAVRIWLANGEQETLQAMCDEIGSRTVTERIEGGNWLMRKLGLSDVPARYQRVERPVLYLQQARDFLDRDRGQAIATRTGKPPFFLQFDGYDRALPLWRFDHDPRFRQPILKALMRNLFSRFWTERDSEQDGRTAN
ncbi:MAG TPA: type IV secretory system conjugative DNA transfer family protein [Bryobacteraceae bacterium]|jgi:type IV secretory pathway TraG/TraD family ATPase VirD4